jgi:hypothetical protein
MSKRKDPNIYPPGLNATKVADIIAYYDARQEVDLLEEPDHALVHEPTAWVQVPVELVPAVRKLVSQRRKTGAATR